MTKTAASAAMVKTMAVYGSERFRAVLPQVVKLSFNTAASVKSGQRGCYDQGEEVSLGLRSTEERGAWGVQRASGIGQLAMTQRVKFLWSRSFVQTQVGSVP